MKLLFETKCYTALIIIITLLEREYAPEPVKFCIKRVREKKKLSTIYTMHTAVSKIFFSPKCRAYAPRGRAGGGVHFHPPSFFNSDKKKAGPTSADSL